jgi:hypothetical protein
VRRKGFRHDRSGLQLFDECARRVPVCTLVSLEQDVNLTVNTPAEVGADD